jgi:hypothetical protein
MRAWAQPLADRQVLHAHRIRLAMCGGAAWNMPGIRAQYLFRGWRNTVAEVCFLIGPVTG